MKGGKLEPYQTNYKPTKIRLETNMTKNSAVAEFSLNDAGDFIFKDFRTDKTDPNSLRTVMNVINSFKNPVNVNDLYYFLNLSEKSTKEELKRVLQYSSHSKLLRCVSTYKTFTILEPNDTQKINEMIKNINAKKDIEVELRLGKIINRFDTNISKDKFSSLINKLNSSGFKKEISDFVDVNSDGIRTRYVFSQDYEKYILFESIIKNKITNIDLKLYQFLNFDIRVSMSSEVKIDKYNLDGESYRKYRVSFIDPNSLFRLDFTSVKQGQYVDRLFLPNEESLEQLQVEVEILSNTIDANNLFKFLTNLLNF